MKEQPIVTPKEKNNSTNHIQIFRYRYDELEAFVEKEHQKIKPNAIDLGQDLAAMNKPEPEQKKDIYTGEIKSSYSRLLAHAKKELQTGIEMNHISSETKDFSYRLSELKKDRQKKETELRLKERELEKCNPTLLKNEERYKTTRIFLIFLILVDLALSSSALMAMGYSNIVAIIVGLGIGTGIFFLAENLPEIINKGKTGLSKWLIAIAVFSFLFSVFYVLGQFRSTMFRASNDDLISGTNPLYFAVLNLFFTLIASLVVYFKGLTKSEKKQLDRLKTLKEEVDRLQDEVKNLKNEIVILREDATSTEMSRKYLLLYADDIRDLIQRCYEESLEKFHSTNCIYRSDGLTPKFFGDPAPELPSIKHELKF